MSNMHDTKTKKFTFPGKSVMTDIIHAATNERSVSRHDITYLALILQSPICLPASKNGKKFMKTIGFGIIRILKNALSTIIS